MTDQKCTHCNNRGWVALAPRYLGDWMMALANHLILIENIINDKETYWQCSIDEEFDVYADTPGLAFFQVAMKAMNLPTETETA